MSEVISTVFDRTTIHNHFWMLHHLAERTGLPGKLVLSAIPPAKDAGLYVVNQHFQIGDVDGMTAAAMVFEGKPYGLYAPYCIMRHDLPKGERGAKEDVIATLAYAVDADSDHEGKAIPHAPVDTNYEIESSPGNFQEVMILDRALMPADSKPLALALKEMTGDNKCVGDISRIMRVPGTLNWPNKAKMERGRSPDPQPVKVRKTWNSWTTIEALRAAIATYIKPEPVEQHSDEPPALNGYRIEEVSWWIDRKKENGDLDWSQQDWAMFGGALKLHFGDNGLELFQRVSNDPDQAERRFDKFPFEYSEGDRTLHWYLERRDAKDSDWMWRHVFGCPCPPALPLAPLPVGAPLPEGWPWKDGNAERISPQSLIVTDAEFVADFVTPSYLVEGIWRRGYLYTHTAMTGGGKTAQALLLTECIGLGRPFAGREVQQGRVLYFAAENFVDVQMRWIAQAQHHRFEFGRTNVHFVFKNCRLSEISEQIKREAAAYGDWALVIVDTSQATFEGDEANSDVQQVEHARRMRDMTRLPGNPTLILLAHPVKRPLGPDDLLPKGGGGMVNEVDGNTTSYKRMDGLVQIHWCGKLRGPDFDPILFEMRTVIADRLKDDKGRHVPTVLAVPAVEAQGDAADAKAEQDALRLLQVMDQHPGGSLAQWASLLEWTYGKLRQPHKQRVSRTLEGLRKEGRLVEKVRGRWKLTAKGQQELNAHELASKNQG